MSQRWTLSIRRLLLAVALFGVGLAAIRFGAIAAALLFITASAVVMLGK